MKVRPSIKGMARAVRGNALVHSQRFILTRFAEELFFERAEVLVEGDFASHAKTGDPHWFGTTYVTCDLADLANSIRGLETASAHEAFFQAVSGSVRVRLRCSRLARQEISRRFPDRVLGRAEVETRMRRVGTKLQVDVDLEVPIQEAVARRRQR